MPTSHYVDNKKLLEELIKHRELVKTAKINNSTKPRLSNYVGNCILLIANKLSNRPNFINYPFKEEMVSDGIENCLMYIDNFDPEKSSNPFAYITQIIYYAFVRRITKEKKYLYTKHKLLETTMIYSEHVDQSEWNEIQEQHYFENEHMNDFVKAFEDSIKKKKQKEKIVAIDPFIKQDIDSLEMEVIDHDTDSINN